MVINVKWGFYAGGAALVLAFIISIFLGRADIIVAFIRAISFAAIFFVLGTGIWTLINMFIPELLFSNSGNDAVNNIFAADSSDSKGNGSRVNITVGGAALPDNNADEVGNIADLLSGAVNPAEEARKARGLDQTSENVYTDMGKESSSSQNGPVEQADDGVFTMNFGNFGLGGESEGLESYGDSFSLPAGSGGAAKEEEESLPERKVTGNKPEALEGDFSPKEIAAGIRTVLEKDKKG